MRFYPLEKLINLHDGYRTRFKIDQYDLLLIQHENERYLIESRCPHRNHALDVASIDGEAIECALHRYRFALRDGALISSTEEPCRALRTFELVYRDNELGVML